MFGYQYDLMVQIVIMTHSRKDIPAPMVNAVYLIDFIRLCLSKLSHFLGGPRA